MSESDDPDPDNENRWIYDPLISEVVPRSAASRVAIEFDKGPTGDYRTDGTSDDSDVDEDDPDAANVDPEGVDSIPF